MLIGIIVFTVCVISGLMTGLLGIGGGLVIVPFFLFILPLFGLHFSITEIVAISATCVFFNSAMTVFYRRNQQYLPKDLIIKMGIAIIVGTVTGSYIMKFVPEKLIFLIYIIVSLFSLFSFINKRNSKHANNAKSKFILYILFALFGGISSMIGIGGAILFAAALKFFISDDTKGLLPTVTLIVLIHAFFAFSSKIVLGEIVLYMIPISIVASMLGSKIGIKLSEKLSSKAINCLYCVVLVLGLAKMSMMFIG